MQKKKKSTAYNNENSENSYRKKLQVISDWNTLQELLLEGFFFLASKEILIFSDSNMDISYAKYSVSQYSAFSLWHLWTTTVYYFVNFTKIINNICCDSLEIQISPRFDYKNLSFKQSLFGLFSVQFYKSKCIL